MMKKFLSALAFLAVVVACVEKTDPEDPTPKAPEAISLSADELVFTTSAAGTLQLTITAPARPKVEIPSEAKSWLQYVDGTFKDYSITVGLSASENKEYVAREAVLTISSTGVPSVNVKVSQAAADKPEDPPVPPDTDNDAKKLSRVLRLGWNMGNHFDAFYNGSWAGEKEGYPDEEVWGGAKATQATFNGVAKAGFSSVRIPVSWLKMIGDAPDYKINQEWLDRVYEVANFAHNAGLYVIVNTHHDENHGVNNTYQWLDIKNAAKDPSLNAEIKAEIYAVWTQIAQRFADCEDWLILESFNELNDGGWGWSTEFRADPTRQCNILNEWNQVFVDAVRGAGGHNATRWLGVPTYAANPEFEKYLTLPDDPAGKTMVAVHFYDPFDYTLGEPQYTDWGHTAAPDRKADGGDEDHVRNVFNNLYTKYVANNVPVYLGEFGCSMRSMSNSRAWAFFLYYLEYVCKAANTYCLPCFLWDNGAVGDGQEKHGYIHHGTGNYIGSSKIPIDKMVKAWNNDSDSYTLQSVYDSAPRF